MKTNIMIRPNEVIFRPILSSPIFNQTTRITTIVKYDGYVISLTIIKPFCYNKVKHDFSAFLFVPSITNSQTSLASSIEVASELVMASGQAAVIMNNEASYNSENAFFELLAAMKWIIFCGEEKGINGNKIAIVGSQLGANIAATLSLMALSDDNSCIRSGIQSLSA